MAVSRLFVLRKFESCTRHFYRPHGRFFIARKGRKEGRNLADSMEPTNSQTEAQAQQDNVAPPEKPEVDWEAKYKEMQAHSREWEARAKANKTAADEADKARREADELKAQLEAVTADRQQAAWRDEAAKEAGVPASLLHGTSEEEIKASAAALKQWGEQLLKPRLPQADNPSKTPQTVQNPNRQVLRQLFGN